MSAVADKNALKAGFFILAALIAAVAIFVTVGEHASAAGRTWLVQFDMSDDVGGLATGSEVRVGGVKKGQVRRVHLDMENRQVLVQVLLPRDVILREVPSVQVQSTVTGVTWLNFSDVGRGEPLGPNDPIRGEAGSLAAAIGTVGELAPQVSALIRDAREDVFPKAQQVLEEYRLVASDARSHLGPGAERYHEVADAAISAIESIQHTADRTGEAAETLAELLGEGRGDLATTIENIRQATDRLPGLLDDSRKLVGEIDGALAEMRDMVNDTGQRLSGLLEDASGIAEDVGAITGDTRVTARDVRGIVAGNRGKLEQIVERMRDTSRTLSLASSEIRRSPWRLMYRPDGRQRDSLDLYDAARRFAEGASALQDAAIALQDANNDPTADAERVQQMIDQLDARFRQFDQIERELLNRLRE